MKDLQRIDWNLVSMLHALLVEKNVSRAAQRLGVGQPAASRALARLRRHFDDELLVREGSGYVLTSLAQQLAPVAADAVAATESILGSSRRFDPTTSQREFVIASTEYAQLVVGSRLVQRLREQAPHVRLHFKWPAFSAPATSWLGDLDGWFGPRDVFTDVPSTGLHTDRWVCVVSADHPDIGETLTIDQVARHSWILPTVPKDRDLPWVKRLLAHGLELPIAATTESFASVPFLVAGTRNVGMAQEALATRLGSSAGTRVIECPWPMAPLNLTLWWHPTKEHDPAHIWLREQVLACVGG